MQQLTHPSLPSLGSLLRLQASSSIMKCLLILALVAGVAHAGLFSSKPKPTAGEKALCTSDGKFDDLCTIYEKDGVQESKEGGQVWRVVKCSCYGEGADEAADIVAKEVATAIGQCRLLSLSTAWLM